MNTVSIPLPERDLVMAADGGWVTDWCERGMNIFFPRTNLVIDGEKKLRGGMHPCFPNFGAVDEKHQLPQHGPLCRRFSTDSRTESSYERRWRISATDLLGAYSGRCVVSVTTKELRDGFEYVLTAALSPDAPRAVPIGMGLHPYFATPQGTATVRIPGRMDVEVVSTIPKSIRIPLTKPFVTIAIPGIGRVEMDLLGEFRSGLRHPVKTARIVIWRDSEQYVCVEPALAVGEDYGSAKCPVLQPGRSMTIGCCFRLLPN